jgi:hypothetical protein
MIPGLSHPFSSPAPWTSPSTGAHQGPILHVAIAFGWSKDLRSTLAFLDRAYVRDQAIDGDGIAVFIKPTDRNSFFAGFHWAFS